MAARNDIAQRKLALLQDLRALHREQDGAIGATALKQRELSERYGLSIRTISLALQELVEEGVLYTVPRVGTFLGRASTETTEPYLIVSQYERIPNGFFDNFRIGFEDRIAQLGGATLAMTEEEALWHAEQGNLPKISGVFEIGAGMTCNFGPTSRALLEAGVSGASFGPLEDSELPIDLVDFDNEDGGAQAARHMLSVGHREIAFLGLNNEHNVKQFRWSFQRENGWRRAMNQAGRDTSGAIFRPAGSFSREHVDQIEAAAEAAGQLLDQRKFTAVVAVNVFAAHGLMRALRDRGVPADRWPAMMCFDVSPKGAASMLSFLRLPWDKVGTEAAQLLWERRNGRLKGQPQQRLVPMQLIPRLTCRSDWAASSGLAQSHVNGTVPTAF